MCKNFFYRFLHFEIFNLNQLLKNKIEPIEPTEPVEPKLDHIFLLLLFYCYKIFYQSLMIQLLLDFFLRLFFFSNIDHLYSKDESDLV